MPGLKLERRSRAEIESAIEHALREYQASVERWRASKDRNVDGNSQRLHNSTAEPRAQTSVPALMRA